MSIIFDDERVVRSVIGTDLWVATKGSGPAIVLCDGLGCDGFIWKYLVDELAQEYQVIRWHYRGHGRSELPPSYDALRIEGFAADLFRVLDALGVEQATLAGHSMGVQVILEAYFRTLHGEEAPERIRALVALCGMPGRPLDTFKNTNVGLTVLPILQSAFHTAPNVAGRVWTNLVASPLTLKVAEWMEINARLMSVEDLRPYLERLSVMDPRAFLATLRHASEHSVEPDLARIEVPALIIGAERDTFTPVQRSVNMADAIPTAELFVLPDATHTGPLEWPEMTYLRLRKFLKSRVDVPK